MSLPQNLGSSADKTPVEPTIIPDVEDASDAVLRAWARENNIDDVPGSGRLSAAWREQLTEAMAAELDPKEEDSAEATSSEESTTEEEVVEYRSVFQPPNTFVNSQSFTA